MSISRRALLSSAGLTLLAPSRGRPGVGRAPGPGRPSSGSAGP